MTNKEVRLKRLFCFEGSFDSSFTDASAVLAASVSLLAFRRFVYHDQLEFRR
jgi:hypothetical protein